MPSYEHLSPAERDEIAVLRAAGHSQATTARAVGRWPSTLLPGAKPQCAAERCAAPRLQSADGRYAVQISVEVELQERRRIVGGASSQGRLQTGKTQDSRVELVDISFNDAHWVVLGHIVFQRTGKSQDWRRSSPSMNRPVPISLVEITSLAQIRVLTGPGSISARLTHRGKVETFVGKEGKQIMRAIIRSVVFAALTLSAGQLAAAQSAATCSNVDQAKCMVDLSTGIRLAYVEVGPVDGPAVILLHGLTDSARSWSQAMAALHEIAPSLHILALDQRGHGASSMPAEAHCPTDPKSCFTPKLFADDLLAFMDKAKITTALIVGHSMGSVVAQTFALDHPDRTKGIVLVATSAKTAGNAIISNYVLKEPVLGSWKTALGAKGIQSPEAVWTATPLDADPEAESWIGKNWDVDPAANPAMVAAITTETSRVKIGTWIGATEALLASDNTSRLRDLKVPALVLWGSQDSIFYREPDQTGIRAVLAQAATAHGTPWFWKQYGVDQLPASGAQESDIGHNVQWDAPREVAADIASFQSSGRPTPDGHRSVFANGSSRIVTDPGKAIVKSSGQ